MMRVTPEVNEAVEFLAWSIQPNAPTVLSRNAVISSLVAYAQSLPIGEVRAIYDRHTRGDDLPLRRPDAAQRSAITAKRTEAKRRTVKRRRQGKND